MVLAQLAGCAGRTPYADESATKNVSIHTATSAKSIWCGSGWRATTWHVTRNAGPRCGALPPGSGTLSTNWPL